MTTILDIPGSNPPNRFSSSIESTVTSTNYSSLAEETAKNIIESINTCSDPAHALWELWDAFFMAVVSYPSSHGAHIALLDAIRAQPPSQPSNVPAESDAKLRLRSYTKVDGRLHWSKLPLFHAQWRDVHDILHEWRDWDGIRDPSTNDSSTGNRMSSSGDQLYLRFSIFSALLLKSSKDTSATQTVWVFYACKDVLEREAPQSYEPKKHKISSEQVWALDVRVAATWVRDGGWSLWNTDHEELREYWAAALDEKTALWPREDGLIRERWQLWKERLWALSTDEASLDQETRTVTQEAYGVIEDILRGV